MKIKITLIFLSCFLMGSALYSQTLNNMLNNLTRKQDYVSKRVSSYDLSGANVDNVPFGPGETRTIADIKGPGIIHHIGISERSNIVLFLSFCCPIAVLPETSVAAPNNPVFNKKSFLFILFFFLPKMN